MNKILLVIRREYVTRVRKKSFWLLTIVVPLLVAALYAIPLYLSLKPTEQSVVAIADESGIFGGLDRNDTLSANCRFVSGSNVTYRYAASLEYALRQLDGDDPVDAVLYVRSRSTQAIPTDACLYYKSQLPPQTLRYDVDRQLQQILRNRLLRAHDISDDEYALISNTKINLRTEDLETGREAFLEVKTGMGLLLSMLIYFAIFMFGSQVMRGVVEEKANRIVEVLVCSLKPLQLMIGKIVGIALVGITQFLLWVVLSGAALGIIQASHADLFHQASQRHQVAELATKGVEATSQMEQLQTAPDISPLLEGLTAINYGPVLLSFLFFFLFGYLLYASLFAAAGALSDTDTDTQIFSLPLTVPLLITLLLMPAMINAPSGTLSQFLSIFPLTSPIAMMLRIPFGVPLSQLYLSMALLVGTFPLTAWLSAVIYRRSILSYGLSARLAARFRRKS